ncbi:MAG: DUF4843 domain-containing protein [Bacteroidia bacterium]|nr:DUF4843 domain-containing protein [Bacteroidia bacterium]
MYKKIFYTLLVFVAAGLLTLQTGCKKDDYLLFNAPLRVQWKDTVTVNQTFASKKEAIVRDTVWLKANVMGGSVSEAKKVKIKQIKGVYYSYTYDKAGAVIDTIATEAPNQAIPGTHYVAFDSEEMQKLLVQKTVVTNNPKGVEINIPVIVLRDASLSENNYLLFIQLEQSEDFLPGESQKTTKIISISNRITKPSKWSMFEEWYFGKYTYVKHKFMNETLQTVIDNAWFSQPRGILIFYREKCRRALEEFNADPENIAKGIAPLKEDPDNPKSKPMTFPTYL